jgi:Putative zinc-finger
MALRDHADDPGGHVAERLESYLLGGLTAAQEYEVESHLLRCARCRAEADASCELALAMARLTPEEVRALELGRRSAPAPAPTTANRAESTSPTDTRRESRRGRRRSSRRTLAVYAVILVVGLVIGAAGVRWISPGSINGRSAGNESVDTNGGGLTVTLSDRGDTGSEVRAVVVGLRPGLAYKLIAVGQDGRNYTIAGGVAAGGPQTLQGRLDGPAADVVFFAVLQPDAGLLFVTLAP